MRDVATSLGKPESSEVARWLLRNLAGWVRGGRGATDGEVDGAPTSAIAQPTATRQCRGAARPATAPPNATCVRRSAAGSGGERFEFSSNREEGRDAPPTSPSASPQKRKTRPAPLPKQSSTVGGRTRSQPIGLRTYIADPSRIRHYRDPVRAKELRLTFYGRPHSHC